jgi:hypothetical protein
MTGSRFPGLAATGRFQFSQQTAEGTSETSAVSGVDQQLTQFTAPQHAY